MARSIIKRRVQEEAKLQLTSMMDIFTNILIFLLMNVSSVQLEIQASDDLTLPPSISTKEPELNFSVIVQRQAIYFEDHKVLDLEDGEIPRRYHNDAHSPWIIVPLKERLTRKVEDSRSLAEATGGEVYKFKGRLLFQVHKDIDWKVLREVMVTAADAGFGEFKFIVEQI